MAATVYYRQALTGGGATALDEIAGSTLNDNDIAFVMTDTAFYVYKVDSSSGAAESSPNVIAPDTPSADERWILQQVQNVQSLEYEEITTSTALEVGKTYNDSSGTNTHTLPLLSGTSAGETINLYITGTSRAVTINEHATDGSDNVFIGYVEGDHVTMVSDGSSWLVRDERSTVEVILALSADDAIAAQSAEKIFDTGYTELRDTAGAWSTSTDRFTAPYDCFIEFGAHLLLQHTALPQNGQSVSAEFRVNGTSAITGGAYTTDIGTFLRSLNSGHTIEIYARNADDATFNVMGDPSLDESRAFFRVIRRER